MDEKYFKKASDVGEWLIRFVAGVLAACFLFYGALMLWDMYRTEINAFKSHDLMKYKPSSESKKPYLYDLMKENKDVIAWLTLDGTNVDYPVLQGKDNSVYVNRDALGNPSSSGSLFLDSQNKRDFSDAYNLIYGHHVNNGTMFGDLDKYKDKLFFNKNTTGILVLPNMAYDLDIMACIETNAYDRNIYWVENNELPKDISYIKEKAVNYRELGSHEKILALSTCDDSYTSGRTIVICKMSKRTKPLPSREESIPKRTAIGHPLAGGYWAILNFICLLLTFYILIPIKNLREKKWKSKKTISEIFFSALALFLFVITEDPHKPMQMVDFWTPNMIFILGLSWLVSSGGLEKLIHGKESP